MTRALSWTLAVVTLVIVAVALMLSGRGGAEFPGISIGFLVFLPVGLVIAHHRPRNPIGWIFLIAANIAAITGVAGSYPSELHPWAEEWAAWVASWTSPLSFGLLFLITPLIFPNGELLSRRWRWALFGATGALGLAATMLAVLPGRLDCCPVQNPLGIEAAEALLEPIFDLIWPVLALFALTGAVSLVIRYRRAIGEEKLQMKWFAFAVALAATALVVFNLLGFLGIELDEDSFWGNLPFFMIMLGMSLATAFSILKYRLYEIDVVINKTVVYGALAAFITAVYVGVVVGIGALVGVGNKPNLGLSLAATAIVAVAFQPVRERVQRFANKLVYGERVTPYEAVTSFSHRMAESLSFEQVLPQMAEAAAKGVGGTRSLVKLFLPGGGEQVVAWPADSSGNSFDRSLAVVHQGKEVGEISVAKSPGEQITKSEDKLLQDLASQAGLAMRNLRLTGELQQKLIELQESRKRIVAAQDEERRRLERDIHDGAQQQLVAMSVKLGLAQSLLGKDPAKAASLLDDLSREAGETVETLRDLARGFFPQLLADRGLVAALEGHVSKTGLDVAVEDGVGAARFDVEVETNVYFVIREALQNASKHAPGARISIRLWAANNQLAFAVRDQGPGFDLGTVRYGSGIQNMKDRVEALGGGFEIDAALGRGTEIRGRTPIRVVEPVG